MRRVVVTLLLSVAAAAPGVARSAEVPREEYLRLVPLGRPRLVQQTPASERLHLYGDRSDPAYRDVDPADGIDDRRHAVLLDLAVRFAPYLVQNTSEFPTNFDAYVENADAFPLTIDTWDVTAGAPRLIRSTALDFARIGEVACGESDPHRALETHPDPTTDPAIEDCKLLSLLDRFGPGGTPPEPAGDPNVKSRPELVDVLFFDFPGEGPATWKAGYEPEYRKSSEEVQRSFPHAYVHPFLRSVVDEAGRTIGYEFVCSTGSSIPATTAA